MICCMCSNDALILINDIKEVEGIKDEQGKSWRAWEPDGPPVALCEVHKRMPRVTYLPTTSAHEIQKMKEAEYNCSVLGQVLHPKSE